MRHAEGVPDHAPSPRRRLVVLRHARAEATAPSDAERALTPQGRDDARALGGWLAGCTDPPDVALVSAAVRARQTWEALADGAGWAAAPTHDEGLYAADPDTALDLVRAVDDSAAVVVLVGHNPTMGYLAQLLGDGEGDPAAEAQMTAGFPTAAAAVLAHDGSWSDLTAGGSRVEAFHVGRG